MLCSPRIEEIRKKGDKKSLIRNHINFGKYGNFLEQGPKSTIDIADISITVILV